MVLYTEEHVFPQVWSMRKRDSCTGHYIVLPIAVEIVIDSICENTKSMEVLFNKVSVG